MQATHDAGDVLSRTSQPPAASNVRPTESRVVVACVTQAASQPIPVAGVNMPSSGVDAFSAWMC